MTDPRFPVLTQKQISTLKEFGTVITFENENAVFEVGDNSYDFYVVLDGVKSPLNQYNF
jgi:thioredoxin reductase (NADPH)